MRAGRRLGRRDLNESAIVDALRKAGFRVRHISQKGFCDIVVYSERVGVRLLEVKSAKGKLTADQVRHTAEGWPVQIVRDVADALKAVGITQ